MFSLAGIAGDLDGIDTGELLEGYRWLIRRVEPRMVGVGHTAEIVEIVELVRLESHHSFGAEMDFVHGLDGLDCSVECDVAVVVEMLDAVGVMDAADVVEWERSDMVVDFEPAMLNHGCSAVCAAVEAVERGHLVVCVAQDKLIELEEHEMEADHDL